MAKILVVDDSAVSRQALLRLLDRMGHKLLEVADGNTALATVRAERPDLVISNILMRPMDGFEFVRRLRAEPDIAATPVIFNTATYAQPMTRELAAACGVTSVLPNLSEPKVIVAAVNIALGLTTSIPPELLSPLSSTTALHELERINEEFAEYADEVQTVRVALSQTSEMGAEPNRAVDQSVKFAVNLEGLQQLGGRLTTLVELMFGVRPEQGMAHVVELFFAGACKMMGSTYAAVGLYDDAGQELKHILAQGFTPELHRARGRLRDGLPESLMIGQISRHIRGGDRDEKLDGLPQGHPAVRELVGAAVVHRDRVHGWIYFANEADGGFTDADERIIATLAAELALFYENVALYDLVQMVQRQAVHLQAEADKQSQAERDTRERDHQLAQAQKMEAIGQLTGGIAHDFNNLLTVITGSAEDLHDDLASQPVHQQQIDLVLQAAKRGAELVRQLMTIARKQELRPQVIALKTLFDPLAKLLRRTLQENIAIEFRHAADLHPVNVDPGSLENVILNLAINARDAMPNGGVLTIEAENVVLDEDYIANQDVRPGGYIQIAVSDTGTGMPKEVADRAFEPFFTTKEMGKGTGLGLSMVFGFVKQSGGHAKIYSEPGLGTTIKIYLPTTTAPVSAHEAIMVDLTASPATGHVLLVEDDDLVRESVSRKLKRLGYTVTTASTPAEAIAKLETMLPFDLILTDIIMPGSMTGADLARVVQDRWPATKVLATSGYTETTMLGKIKIPEGVRLLSKPYSNVDFARTLREVLAG